jgi:2-polyprenyl-3-methyl-5-hydroxy-6-metoxy-1,4-benzoquinol methylase
MTSGDSDSYANNTDFWIKIIQERLDAYRTGLTDAAVLSAVGPCDGLVILDGGCGEGYLSRLLVEQGATASGIDTSPSLIAAAREEAERLGLEIDYRVGSLEDMPFPDMTFDVVVGNHVLSDLQDPQAALAEIGRVKKSAAELSS